MKIPAEFTQYEWPSIQALIYMAEYSDPADSSAICENRKTVDSAVMKAAYPLLLVDGQLLVNISTAAALHLQHQHPSEQIYQLIAHTYIS